MTEAADSPFVFRLAAIGIAALFFVAIAPTLRWQEFTSGSENLVVTTAMEMHRGGPKLVPNLQGEKRIAKPPLPAWVTYLSISPATMRGVGSPDPTVRAIGFSTLGWQARLPALLAAALLLIATYELGRAVRSPRVGLLATCVAASTLMLLRFGRASTTDIHLALWVSVANACIAHGLCRGKIKVPWIGGGIALGLAMMCKGPVCLVQTLLPAFVFMLIRRTPRKPFHPIPVIIGTLLFVAVGLSWYVYVFATTPGVMGRWFSEVSRLDARDSSEASSLFYSYFSFIPFLFPWIVFFIVGVIITVMKSKRQSINDLLPLLMTFVPIVVMTFFKDRQERYLLPLIAPAAVVAAIGLREHLKSWAAWSSIDTVVTAIHWVLLAIPALIAAVFLGDKMLFIAAGIVALSVIVGAIAHRVRQVALPAFTLAILLGLQAVAVRWYSQSEQGSSELRPLADTIATQYPTADVFAIRPDRKRPPPDLAVYLNRIVRSVPTADTIEASNGPAIALMIQRRGELSPLAPPGFRYLDKALRDKKDFWWAFVRDTPTN